LHTVIRMVIEPGSTLYTDAWRAYQGLTGYVHGVVDHTVEYVNGRIHTNGIENFWSLLKRALKGTYISVEPFHLGRYVDEQVFRFNLREGSDADRFNAALRRVTGKRLTYRELTRGTLAATAA
jgi:transposase-like protein